MRAFVSKLFGKSPFGPLMEHMSKAEECVALLKPLMDAFIEGDNDKVAEMKYQISRLEHEADEIKNAIRDHIPRGVFLPVGRGDFMAVLKVQDRFPDTVEDIAAMMILRPTRCPDFLKPRLSEFVDKVIEAFNEARDIIKSLSELVASSFSGPECEKTLTRIKDLGHLEWEADNLQFALAKELFKRESELDPVSLYFLNSIFKKLGSLANHAESIGDRMRVLIAS